MTSKILMVTTAFAMLVFARSASAHQPNYVSTSTAITDNEGSVSKAYYGELAGQPAVYSVVATSGFELDVNILSPDIPGAKKDFSVTIVDSANQKVIDTLNMPPVAWNRWYEDFGGDWYWQGPEIKQQVPAGTYRITVQNAHDRGKYVLAVGEAEVFPPSAALRTMAELFTVKTVFFGEPWWGIYRGTIGKYLLYATIAIVVIVLFLVWLFARAIRRKASFY